MTLKQRIELLKKQVAHVRKMCCVIAEERKAQYKYMKHRSKCMFCDFFADRSCGQSGCVFEELTEARYSPELFNREIGEILTKIGG